MIKKRHIDNKTNKPSIEAILFKDIDGYAMVKYEENSKIETSRVNNWLGVKKQYNIQKKDLPLVVKGYKNKFSGRVFGTRVRDDNFVVTKIINVS